MRPGTKVVKDVVIPGPRRLRYETLELNRDTPRTTYPKQGVVRWVDWKNQIATVRWADGTTSKENFSKLRVHSIC